MRRSSAGLVLQAAVMCVLVGGTTAFVSLDKTVTLSVDGHRREVRSFGRTVGDVLQRAGVHVDSHDLVAPSKGALVDDGAHLSVRHGRLLALTVDGQTRQVWVTATKVEAALDQLDVRDRDAYLSASRSRSIPLDGMALDVRTQREVTVIADDKRREVQTTAGTVRGALSDAHIHLGPKDEVSAPLGSFPEGGQVLKVTRTGTRRVTVDEDVPFDTVEKDDPDMTLGDRKVVRKGHPGVRRKVYKVEVVRDHVRSRTLVSSTVVQKPVDEVVEVGTKKSSTGAEDLNWDALAQCESGGDPNSYNPSGPYYGLYQFSASTWHSVGGTGVPTDASADEQTYRAQLLYKRSGASQWPVCGQHLYD